MPNEDLRSSFRIRKIVGRVAGNQDVDVREGDAAQLIMLMLKHTGMLEMQGII